jgi:cytochrome b561
LRYDRRTVQRTDLPDDRLLKLMAAVVVAIVAWFAVRRWLPAAWREPGSPELYLTGVAGVLLLLVPAAFALVKRGGASRNPVGWFNAHVWCSALGAVLVVVHSGGFLRRPPALLLLAVLALAVLGVWARVRGSRRMAATFASKAPAFAAPDAATRARLEAIIAAKRGLLRDLDPQAREGTFSVTLAHWLRSPRLARAYDRLAREEASLLGTRRAVHPYQAWWRPLHMALAWIFVLGVAIHVATVTFFAGYVADGGPITWWHLAR